MFNLLFDYVSVKYLAVLTSSILVLSSNITRAIAKPIKIGTATTFDFKGCTKSSSENDIICVGNFRNRDADRRVGIVRTSSTFITDYSGKNYTPDEIRVSDQSCRRGCGTQYVNLVEGVDYKTLFIFKDVSLPSPKIALLQINMYSVDDIKIRNISVVGKDLSTSYNSSGDSSENVTSSLTNQEELQNAANEVENQDRERIAAAQAEQLKKDREALARKRKQSASVSKKPASSWPWLDQQVNQGILDLLGKPKKPGKK